MLPLCPSPIPFGWLFYPRDSMTGRTLSLDSFAFKFSLVSVNHTHVHTRHPPLGNTSLVRPLIQSHPLSGFKQENWNWLRYRDFLFSWKTSASYFHYSSSLNYNIILFVFVCWCLCVSKMSTLFC